MAGPMIRAAWLAPTARPGRWPLPHGRPRMAGPMIRAAWLAPYRMAPELAPELAAWQAPA